MDMEHEAHTPRPALSDGAETGTPASPAGPGENPGGAERSPGPFGQNRCEAPKTGFTPAGQKSDPGLPNGENPGEADRSGGPFDQIQREAPKTGSIPPEQASTPLLPSLRSAFPGWVAQAEALRQGDYPDFDFLAESRNPAFRQLVRSGLPVRTAYEALHLREILARAVRETEEQVASDIRARGSRPAETGATAQAPFLVKGDVSRFTKADRAEIARRAMKGEIITF